MENGDDKAPPFHPLEMSSLHSALTPEHFLKRKFVHRRKRSVSNHIHKNHLSPFPLSSVQLKKAIHGWWPCSPPGTPTSAAAKNPKPKKPFPSLLSGTSVPGCKTLDKACTYSNPSLRTKWLYSPISLNVKASFKQISGNCTVHSSSFWSERVPGIKSQFLEVYRCKLIIVMLCNMRPAYNVNHQLWREIALEPVFMTCASDALRPVTNSCIDFNLVQMDY